MSNKSKLAMITAASIGMVVTQTASLLAEKQDSSAAREKVTKITAIDLDEEVFYSALSDEVLEKAAGFGGTVHLAAAWSANATYCENCGKAQPVKKPPSSSKSRTIK